MRFFGYGEDALTHLVVTDRLSELLKSMGDPTAPEDAVVFYRPSFGRRGGSDTTRGASFGEFDAIVGTAAAVYLIETKWSRSAVTRGVLRLADEQRRRHRIFRWYRDRWSAQSSHAWDVFSSAHASAFESEPGFERCRIATSADEGLSLNLGFVLRELQRCGSEVRDVLLYITIDDNHPECPPLENAEGFEPVTMKVEGAHRSGFFSLAPHPALDAPAHGF